MKKILTKTTGLFTILFLATLLFAACMDDDDNGTSYTDLRADFGMIKTNSSAMTVGFTTDDNVYKALAEPKDISGARPDTTYRALIYYYETEQSYVELYGFTLIPVVAPRDSSAFEEIKTDPVGLQSVWVSNNNSYINLTLNLLGSSSSDSDSQIIDIVRSTDEEHGGITKLTLYHDQNNVPEYYTSTVYLSIPVKGNFSVGEEVNLVVNTYSEGTVSKIFTISGEQSLSETTE
ncbi:MAG: hypothetical protein LUC49_04500 [Prevotella sp.]|nr:hypothetical protein [Prevotella sp.]